MRIAVVVQRYGAGINGGAELHARYIAEHLARHASVEVLTTCAEDYVTWRNALPAGAEEVNGVTVRRFPVTRERSPLEFGKLSERVFTTAHSVRAELAWLEAEGPTSPALIAYLQAHDADYDFFVFFSVRYYHAYHGVRAVGSKAILVPTAERDEALGLGIFPPIFRGAGAIMYNSLEERALIQAVSGNHDVPSVVVGVGSDVPADVDPGGFRQRFGIFDRFAIYIGRIDENKGCAELFTYFTRYDRVVPDDLHLVLIGNPIIPVPAHPRIHHLGFVSDKDKFDALAAATVLVMPSYLESLSMVMLEAWALGVPVLANARCDVLAGQCLRSNGGLFYDGFEEFAAALNAISTNDGLAGAPGANGREYYRRHYTWPIVEQKYLDMIERLGREPARRPVEPLPGWVSRWSRRCPPAREVLAGLPTGAVRQRSDARRAAEGKRSAPAARRPGPSAAPAARRPARTSAPSSALRASEGKSTSAPKSPSHRPAEGKSSKARNSPTSASSAARSRRPARQGGRPSTRRHRPRRSNDR